MPVRLLPVRLALAFIDNCDGLDQRLGLEVGRADAPRVAGFGIEHFQKRVRLVYHQLPARFQRPGNVAEEQTEVGHPVHNTDGDQGDIEAFVERCR
ncbi:hypothetical protein D3C76_1361040 [compost metagenome]